MQRLVHPFTAQAEDERSSGIDGATIRLPVELRADDGPERALGHYRLLALEQAERLIRGTATLAPADPLERDLFLVREGAAIDATLAQANPGMRPALDAERAAALSGYGAGGAMFLAAASELVAELATSPRDPARCTGKYDACQMRWASLAQARLPAKTHTAAEPRLTEAVEAVQQTAQALLATLEAWYEEVKRYDWQIDKRSPDTIATARNACEQALSAFEAAATAAAGSVVRPA